MTSAGFHHGALVPAAQSSLARILPLSGAAKPCVLNSLRAAFLTTLVFAIAFFLRPSNFYCPCRWKPETAAYARPLFLDCGGPRSGFRRSRISTPLCHSRSPSHGDDSNAFNATSLAVIFPFVGALLAAPACRDAARERLPDSVCHPERSEGSCLAAHASESVTASG